MSDGLALPNGGVVELAAIPCLSVPEFRRCILTSVAASGRLSALFGGPADNAVRLFAILAEGSGALSTVCADVRGAYPALTPI